jgi:hypothetical protein
MWEDGNVVLAITDCSVSYKFKEVYAVLLSINYLKNCNTYGKCVQDTKCQFTQ